MSPQDDTFVHRPLRVRDKPLTSDVADAIKLLVEQDERLGQGLPRAFDIADVVAMLIEIAHTDDDGHVGPILPIVRRSMIETFGNRLQNSSVFQAGYKQFEKRSALPVVPVTEFFFKNEFGDRALATVLDAMSDFEITQSLPKRTHKMRSAENGDFMRDEDGDILESGSIAGIVVFPPNSAFSLLHAWLMRRARAADGTLRSAISSMEHARPDTDSVETLKSTARTLASAMTRALPTPKREGGEEGTND
jgi:hypothetical protein